MKTVVQDGDSLRVTETVTDAQGKQAVRSWSFVSLADAARQRVEFDKALDTAQKSALTVAVRGK